MEQKENKDLIEKVAEGPAIALEKTVETAEKIANNKPVQKARSFWYGLGPGLTTGASDNDPSGITTYSQAGARFGFQFIWMSIATFPLMSIVQEMCARIGLVTGRGLARNIRHYFPRWVLFTTTLLLFCANTFNIGANLGAMVKSTQLVLPNANFTLLISFFVIISLMLQIFIPYGKYAKYLKYLTLVLFAYIITAFTIKDFDWRAVFESILNPHFNFSKDQIIMICAVLGTTISPYLFFWQTSQEVEERKLEQQSGVAPAAIVNEKAIKKMRIDVWTGMLLTNVVMLFVMAVCASTLFKNGVFSIDTAADAANALRPLAGDKASLLFVIGIVGTGLLSIPVLSGSASYAIAESFGWREGLYHKLKNAYSFYGVIIIAMVIGLLINFTPINPMKALIYAAVINGIVSPIVLVPIVLLSKNKKVMGDKASSPFVTFMGWLVTAIMAVAGLATIYYIFVK